MKIGKEGYKLSAILASKYAPIINHSRMLHEQTQESKFPALREVGATSVDLWIDRLIYRVLHVSHS